MRSAPSQKPRIGYADHATVAGACCIAVLALVVVTALQWGLIASSPAFADDASSSAASPSAASSESASTESAQAADDASSEAAVAATSVDTRPENIVDPTQRADNSFIYDTTITSLFEQASLYDGRTVQVEGEAIGDFIVGEAPSGSGWVTLTAMENNDASSIAVLMSTEQAKQIDHYGRYGVTGTKLQVRGVYHQACEEHQGLPDLHATNSSVLARGVETPDKFVFEDFLPGIAVVLIGALLMGVFYFLRERMR